MKIVQELHQVFGTDKEAPTTLRDLNELKYVDMVIKESMRLYAPVPFIGRETCSEIDVSKYIQT